MYLLMRCGGVGGRKKCTAFPRAVVVVDVKRFFAKSQDLDCTLSFATERPQLHDKFGVTGSYHVQ